MRLRIRTLGFACACACACALALLPAVAAAEPWTVERVPGAPATVGLYASGDELWLAGKSGVVHHRIRNVWRAEATPALVDLLAIAGHGAREIWAVGQAGGVARWDGRRWDALPGDTDRGLHAVTVPSARTAAVLGTRLMTWNGRELASIASRPKFTTLRAIVALGGRRARFLAVGDAGEALVVTGTGRQAPWTHEPTGVTGDLTAVVSCSGEAIAVGAVAVRRDRKGRWHPLPSPPAKVVAAVAQCGVRGVSTVVAIGGEELFVLDVAARVWRREPVMPGVPLLGIAVAGTRHGVVVVGAHGEVATRTGW